MKSTRLLMTILALSTGLSWIPSPIQATESTNHPRRVHVCSVRPDLLKGMYYLKKADDFGGPNVALVQMTNSGVLLSLLGKQSDRVPLNTLSEESSVNRLGVPEKNEADLKQRTFKFVGTPIDGSAPVNVDVDLQFETGRCSSYRVRAKFNASPTWVSTEKAK